VFYTPHTVNSWHFKRILKLKNIFIFSLIFFLTGCKVEIELPVKLSDFDTKGKAVRVTGAMAVEVRISVNPISDSGVIRSPANRSFS